MGLGKGFNWLLKSVVIISPYLHVIIRDLDHMEGSNLYRSDTLCLLSYVEGALGCCKVHYNKITLSYVACAFIPVPFSTHFLKS